MPALTQLILALPVIASELWFSLKPMHLSSASVSKVAPLSVTTAEVVMWSTSPSTVSAIFRWCATKYRSVTLMPCPLGLTSPSFQQPGCGAPHALYVAPQHAIIT